MIPLTLPASLTSYPPAPPTAPWPAHSFNPTAHRAVYQPLSSIHTHTHTQTQQAFVAKVTLQGNGRHLRRIFRVPQTSLLSVWCSWISEQAQKICNFLADIFYPFENIFDSFGRNHTQDRIIEMSNLF